jgi:hypothetical protein
VTARVVPKAKGVPLNVLAGEVAFVPQPTAGMTGGQNLCAANGSWRAVVTFPSCDLVALVDLPSGEIIDGAYVRRKVNADGTAFFDVEELNGQAPSCAAPDCTNTGLPNTSDAGGAEASPEAGIDAGADAADSEAGADGGAAEAGAPAVVDKNAALRPGPIAIIPETGRGFVGLANGEVILSVDVTRDHLAGWGTIPLYEGALGTNRLRLSIDPYGDKTLNGPLIPGRFVGNDRVPERQYLYAIARDGSVRVIQVAQIPEKECETNADPLNLPPGATLLDACIPVQPPALRRPTALGPGLRLPTPAIDIAVADIRPNPVDQSESTVEGAHAWVLTSSGGVYLVNLDPVPRRTKYVEPDGTVLACETPVDCFQEPEPQPNVLRNRNVSSYSLALDSTAGRPRLDTVPTPANYGPHIESVWTQGTANNATATSAAYERTPVFFPDPSAVTPQTWTVTWEGALMAAPRFTGQIRFTNGVLPRLFDPGNDFCRLGLQQGDIVTISGCTDDKQCGLGKKCVLGNAGTQAAGGLPIGGLCLDKAVAESEACDTLLGSVRRYGVTTARPYDLDLVPHKDEIVRPDLRLCTGTTSSGGDGGTAAGDAGTTADGGASGDGGADATDGARLDGSSEVASTPDTPDDCPNPSDPSTSAFRCYTGRCLLKCNTPGVTMGCRTGRTCVAYVPGTDTPVVDQDSADCTSSDCYCADGPALTDVKHRACIGELLGYQVNVGRGFLVAGSSTGIQRTEKAEGGLCVPDKSLDPRVAMRIPMNAPVCENVPENDLDSRCNPDAPDRCSFPATQAKQVSADLLNIAKNTKGKPNACLFDGGPNETDPPNASVRHVHALFRNNEIQFMLTNLEESPSGAFQVRFEVHGGFRPQTVIIPSSVEVTMPRRLFLGPVDALPQQANDYVGEVPYLFVVDQRRLGRTQGGGPTRGQLLRIHPLGFRVAVPPGLQPWYEDFQHSGNLFPIQ